MMKKSFSSFLASPYLRTSQLDDSLKIYTLSDCENRFSNVFVKSLTILSTILLLLSISNTEY